MSPTTDAYAGSIFNVPNRNDWHDSDKKIHDKFPNIPLVASRVGKMFISLQVDSTRFTRLPSRVTRNRSFPLDARVPPGTKVKRENSPRRRLHRSKTLVLLGRSWETGISRFGPRRSGGWGFPETTVRRGIPRCQSRDCPRALPNGRAQDLDIRFVTTPE